MDIQYSKKSNQDFSGKNISNQTLVIMGVLIVLIIIIQGISVKPKIEIELIGISHEVEVPKEGDKYVYENTKKFSISYISFDKEYDILSYMLNYIDDASLYNITIGYYSEPYQFKKLSWMPMNFEEFRKGEILFISYYLPIKYHNSLNYNTIQMTIY